MELEIRYVLTAVDAQCAHLRQWTVRSSLFTKSVTSYYNYIVFTEIPGRKLPCGMPNTTRNVFSQVEGEVSE
jgi:hypothetical protein